MVATFTVLPNTLMGTSRTNNLTVFDPSLFSVELARGNPTAAIATSITILQIRLNFMAFPSSDNRVHLTNFDQASQTKVLGTATEDLSV
jgi:hypothetical protein